MHIQISDYISECHKLGIKVFPPHVNTSFPEFSSDKSGIIFSLTSVKNIGYGFVNAIVSERERNGKFISFYDFCSRLYGKDLNRRNLDSLIKCGALDNLGANRRQMVQATETVLNHLDNTYKNRMSGQIGFFDVISPDSSSEPDFIIPNVTDFSEEDKIRFEKELTGVYLSGHPLDSYLNFCSSFKLDNISDVLNDNIAYQDKCKITLLVIVNSIKKKYTRKNDLMAFIDIEDKSAESEAIAFPSAFNDFGYLLSEGTPVIIHGSVSRSEESVSFIIDSLEPVPTSVSEKHKEKKKAAHGLFLRIDSDQSPQIPVIRNLISVFDEGSVPVFFYYKNNKKYISSGKCSVSDSLLSELRNILGSDNVVYNPD
ncbi:MAG: hypothetical protein IKH65_10820 [Clostridia bacterium]|nr:hypothetical protein [Clostridia bacterium]